MRRRRIYRTRGGVLVHIGAKVKERYRGRGFRWKGAATRVSGGWHGWLWMHLLVEVSS